MNKRHDFARLEREFITTDISLRGLCRKYGITAHSLVTVQAKKGEWREKRERDQARASDAYIERHADQPAHISEGRDLTVRSELPIDALNRIVALTRGGQCHRHRRSRERSWTTDGGPAPTPPAAEAARSGQSLGCRR